MDIAFYNTAGKRIETFHPLKPPRVRMYTCGPTVYQQAHIGNLRSFVFADTVKRVLMRNGYRVKHVINITDVGHLVADGDEGEDKIEAQATKEKKTAREIVDHYTDLFMRDLTALNVITEDVIFPKASEHIAEQIELIGALEKKGFIYRTRDGIYFDTARFPRYTDFAGIKSGELKEGARVERNPEKRNPTDFALWKFSALPGRREQEWESPWGIGFPGWHIECSAMSMKYLGKTFDIHTGGADLIPIHHTNEVAQSEAATGSPFVRYWLHSAFVTMKGEKMAKSTGNIITLDDLARSGIHSRAYRYWLLTAHYRSPIHFNMEAVLGAERALRRLALHVESLPLGGKILPEYRQRFDALFGNDLDTPGALALSWKILDGKDIAPADKRALIVDADSVFGLGIERLATELSRIIEPDALPQDVQAMFRDRERARTGRDWSRADALRAQIAAAGFVLEDTPEGTKIRKLL